MRQEGREFYWSVNVDYVERKGGLIEREDNCFERNQDQGFWSLFFFIYVYIGL